MFNVGEEIKFLRNNGEIQIATIFKKSGDYAIVKWVGRDGVSIGQREVKLTELKKLDKNIINPFKWLLMFGAFFVILFLFYDHYMLKKKVIFR
jgi:hypothetical protein